MYIWCGERPTNNSIVSHVPHYQHTNDTDKTDVEIHTVVTYAQPHDKNFLPDSTGEHLQILSETTHI